MQIKPLFIVILLISFSFVHAQEYTFGIKGGINFNNIGELYHYGNNSGLGTNVTPNEDTVFSDEKEMGTQFGAFAMIAFGKFFIRPEVNYVSSKNNYPLAFKTANWTSTKIDIPLLFGYKIYEPISLYLGPSFSSISDMKLEGVEQGSSYPYVYKNSSTSINAGILAEFGRFGVDLRYQYGITKVEELRVNIERSIYGTNIANLLEYNPSQIQLSIHINIFKINSDNGGHSSGWRGSNRSCPE
ncbi:MAG: outer membrane beta-barrel protein [Candidatus Gastranaerophilales bacterium]|nr:outer membrane beta-barrel protein [Candidatus Gastranaerophilales bacterium]